MSTTTRGRSHALLLVLIVVLAASALAISAPTAAHAAAPVGAEDPISGPVAGPVTVSSTTSSTVSVDEADPVAAGVVTTRVAGDKAAGPRHKRGHGHRHGDRARHARHHRPHQVRRTHRVPLLTRAVHLAAAQAGKPYRYGAAGPKAFDCSGLTSYVFHTRLHQPLPRTADQQFHAVRRVAKRSVRRGDLVFFLRGGHAYHVGVYAGHRSIWHAPYPGTHVRRERLWTHRWVAGVVR